MVVGYMVDIWGIIFYVMMGCIICIRIQHCGMYLSKVIMCCLCWPMKIFIKHASPILFIFSKQMPNEEIVGDISFYNLKQK